MTFEEIVKYSDTELAEKLDQCQEAKQIVEVMAGKLQEAYYYLDVSCNVQASSELIEAFEFLEFLLKKLK